MSKSMIRYSGAAVLGVSMLAMAAAAIHDRSGKDSASESIRVVDGGTGSSAERVNASAVSASSSPQTCTAGDWSVVAPDPNDAVNGSLPLQYQTTHFAFRWKSSTASLATVMASATYMESVFSHFIGTVGFPEPYCNSSNKLKTNVYIGDEYGLTGGLDGVGHMGIWIGPGGLTDHYGLAHEYTHALQGSTGSLQSSPFAGWIWESHANWMAEQMPEFHKSTIHCSAMAVNYPHLYLGSTRMRYCNWQFMEYLKDTYGYGIINDIWRNAPKAGDPAQATGDPFKVLMANRGWSISQLNDELGRFAMHNVNWDYVNPDGTDQGEFFRQQYGSYDPSTDERIWRTATLDPIDANMRRFAVQPYQAPQRWGYNLVRIRPDAGATSISVNFRGIVQSASATPSLPGMANEPATLPVPNSGWRWAVVAIDGAGKSRYSALQRSSSGSLTVNVSSSDRAVYLMVMAAPSQMSQIRWDQAYYSVYRYPWMVQFGNSMPEGFQPGAPSPIQGGVRHANGGGWKGPGANVAATAYVGPYARVLSGSVSGNARIQDHAVVDGGTVSGDAIVSGLSAIRGNTVVKDRARVGTSFLGLGEIGQDIVLSGNAQNLGDVEQRGASFTTGAYYGFVDQAAATDPSRGSNRTTAVPEVTAVPNYAW